MFTESYNLTLYNLQPFTTYGLLVSAQTVAGRGPATRLLSVTTLEEGLAINTSTNRNVVKNYISRSSAFSNITANTFSGINFPLFCLFVCVFLSVCFSVCLSVCCLFTCLYLQLLLESQLT